MLQRRLDATNVFLTVVRPTKDFMSNVVSRERDWRWRITTVHRRREIEYCCLVHLRSSKAGYRYLYCDRASVMSGMGMRDLKRKRLLQCFNDRQGQRKLKRLPLHDTARMTSRCAVR